MEHYAAIDVSLEWSSVCIVDVGGRIVREAILEYEENLLRKDLTAAERERQTILLAAALKKLDCEKSLTPVSASGETGNLVPRLASAAGGRGNKGVAQRVAEKAGITKRAVRKRLKAASAAIGEKIDLDRDTTEELERKAGELERRAERRQHTERKVVRPKRRNPAPCAVTEDATPPPDPHAGESSQIEVARKAFYALASKDQFRFIYEICRSVGLEPLKMASRGTFGLDNEEPELAVVLTAEAAPATDDAADLSAEDLQDAGAAVFQAAEQQPEVVVSPPPEAAPATDDIAVAHPGQPDDATELGAEDLQDAEDDVSKAADQEPVGAMKCAHCKKPLLSNDLPRMKYGRLYHRKDCVNHAKPIAIAA
jgi:hypothetical protein